MKIPWKILILVISPLLLFGFYVYNFWESSKPSFWVGKYEFSESAPAIQGSNQTWKYELSIFEFETKRHVSLKINGFQTEVLLGGAGTWNKQKNSLDFFFKGKHYPREDSNKTESFEWGDILLTLTPVNEGLAIEWKKLQPYLKESQNGSVFKKVKR